MRSAVALTILGMLALLPVAQAQSPVGSITLTLGAMKGLASDGSVPYGGNVTVSATVAIDCSVITYEYAKNGGTDVDHFHVQPDEDSPLPPYIIADELITYFTVDAAGEPLPASTCASGSGTYTQTVDYPFAVSAAAPSGVQLTLNLTANVADDTFAEVVPLHFKVQFHPGYTLTPSAKFPDAVAGNGANLTLTVKNTSNGAAMVMFQDVKASLGTVSGFADTTLPANGTAVLPIKFTGTATCWTTAYVNATAVVMPGAGGATSMPTPISWQFTHTCGKAAAATTGSSKKSPAPGFLMAFAALGLAGLSRRRRA